jgi:hypothetical protein
MKSCFVGGLDDFLVGEGETRIREKSVNNFLVSHPLAWSDQVEHQSQGDLHIQAPDS